MGAQVIHTSIVHTNKYSNEYGNDEYLYIFLLVAIKLSI